MSVVGVISIGFCPAYILYASLGDDGVNGKLLGVILLIGFASAAAGIYLVTDRSGWNEDVSSLFDERVSVEVLDEVKLFDKVSDSFVGTVPLTLADGGQAVLVVDGTAVKLITGDDSLKLIRDADELLSIGSVERHDFGKKAN